MNVSILALAMLASSAGQNSFIVPADAPAIPKITVRGNWPADAGTTIAVGDWRNYGVEGYTGKIRWSYDPQPVLNTDSPGKPFIVYGDVAVKKVDAELTPVRFIDGKFDTSKVPVGDALVGGLAAGKIKLKAIGIDKDGFPDEIATIMIEVVGPRGPPDAPAPPGTKPGQPVVANFFLIVRPDGPASKEYDDIMRLPAWDELRAKGYKVTDVPYSQAAKETGFELPPGMKLPVTVRLNNQPAEKKSFQIGLPVKLPSTNDGIRALEIKP